MKKERCYINIAIACLSLFSYAAIAAPATDKFNDYYQIELIIFANKESYNAAEEYWSPQPVNLTYPGNLISLPKTYGDDESALQLKPLNHLAHALTKLENNQRYKVLFAKSWIQPLIRKQTSPYISISGGQTIDHIDQLAGAIQFYRGRYLHIKTRLWYIDFFPGTTSITTVAPSLTETDLNTTNLWPIPPVNPITWESENTAISEAQLSESDLAQEPDANLNTVTIPQGFSPDIKRIGVMHERRRLKKNRVYYIDHPLFGVLVEIYQYKPAQK